MSTDPQIHPPADTAADLLRDMATYLEKLSDRLYDGKFRVLASDVLTCEDLSQRYRAYQQQQGNANLQAAQENGRD